MHSGCLGCMCNAQAPFGLTRLRHAATAFDHFSISPFGVVRTELFGNGEQVHFAVRKRVCCHVRRAAAAIGGASSCA